MRLAIIGIGAMGSLFAARLQKVCDLTMLGAWVQQIDEIRTNGLTLIHPDGRQTRHALSIDNDPQKLFPCDAALILVKARHTEAAALAADQLLASHGVAVSLQNGLGSYQILTTVLGRSRVIQGSTAQGATMLSAGLVRHAGVGQTYLARTNETAAQAVQLMRLFNQAGLTTKLVDDLRTVLWGKLVVNAAINPLTALLNVQNGFLVSNPQAQALMCAVAEEVAAVALALHIDLPYADPCLQVIDVAQRTAGNHSSMLQDIRRSVPTEIDFINGSVMRNGQQANCPTPLNAELVRLVKLKQGQGRNVSYQSTIAMLNDLLTSA